MRRLLLLIVVLVLIAPVAAFASDAGSTAVTPTARGDALDRLEQEVSGDVVARWNADTGTARWLAVDGGALTGASSEAPARLARAWLSDHVGLFGLSTQAIVEMEVARDHALPGGSHVVWLRQTWDGTPAAGRGVATFAFDADNRLVSVGADLVPVELTGERDLSPGDALRTVAKRAFDLSITPEVTGRRAGFTRFAAGPGFAPHYVRAAVYPTVNGARPAWDVYFIAKMTKGRRALVDASTGAILRSSDLVKSSREEGLVFENHPGAPAGGTQEIRSFEGDAKASPQGWVGFSNIDVDDEIGQDLGLSSPDAVTTLGNNASTFMNWSNFLVPADQANRPIAPNGHFNFGFADAWHRSECRAVLPSYAEDKDSAATNLFYHHNVMHDFFYNLGFTEAAGNLQVVNFTGEGAPGDPIQGLVQAGAATGGEETGYTGRDNAYMLTLPDGLPSWSGMFLWEPINDVFEAPCADGDFAADVIYHEYTHAVSNRMVPDLSGFQGGSMGEAWGDYFAVDYLHKEGLRNDTTLGAYVTGDKITGIRNWKLADVPVTYGDIGFDVVGPEVHADGEIWAGILWRLRERLVAIHGEEKGSERTRQILVSAMPMSAPNPSFIDMRDAIIAADEATYDGQDVAALQGAFAEVGLGKSATSEGSEDTDPKPGFDHPNAALNGTVSGTVTNATTGKPARGVKVIVGSYEARVTPVAETGADGSFSFKAMAGTYPLTFQAPGFGTHPASVRVRAGRTTNASRALRPNLASFVNGAKVSVTNQDFDSAEGLVDDTEGTAWNTGDLGETVNSTGRKPFAEVKLAGDGLVNVQTIRVSAYKNTGSSRFVATRDFKVELINGDTSKTVWQGTFDTGSVRPTSPYLHYKSLSLPTAVQADTARVTIRSVQGETMEEAELAELQVFGTRSGAVSPLPGSKPQPFISETHKIVGTNPTSDAVGGVTENEFVSSCSYPPASNGVDGWVFEIPEELGRGNSNVQSIGEGSPIGHDLDLYFYSSSCSSLGGAASPAADESGAVPFGTRYVVVDQWLGLNTDVHIEVKPF